MARRPWDRRGRRTRDDGDERPTDEADVTRPDDGPGDGTDGDDELRERLDAVTTRFDRPPTADELRAAFRRRHERDQPQAAPVDDFASRYPTESLFAHTVDDPEPAPTQAEDRSRTRGDYYYDPDDAWAVLGVRQGASWHEITAAHRRLAMVHHPDRLLTASEEDREASEETMREVNVAYSVLRRLLGH